MVPIPKSTKVLLLVLSVGLLIGAAYAFSYFRVSLISITDEPVAEISGYDGVADINGEAVRLKELGGGFFKSDKDYYIGYFCCPVMGSSSKYSGWQFKRIEQADYASFTIVDAKNGLARDKTNEYKVVAPSIDLEYFYQPLADKRYDYTTLQKFGLYFVDKNAAYYRADKSSSLKLISHDTADFKVIAADAGEMSHDLALGKDSSYIYYADRPILRVTEQAAGNLPLYNPGAFSFVAYGKNYSYYASRYFSNSGRIYYVPAIDSLPILIKQADVMHFVATSEFEGKDGGFVYTYNASLNEIQQYPIAVTPAIDKAALLKRASYVFTTETAPDGSQCLAPTAWIVADCQRRGGSMRNELIMTREYDQREYGCWTIAQTADAGKKCRVNEDCIGLCLWLAGDAIGPDSSATCAPYKSLFGGYEQEIAALALPLCNK